MKKLESSEIHDWDRAPLSTKSRNPDGRSMKEINKLSRDERGYHPRKKKRQVSELTTQELLEILDDYYEKHYTVPDIAKERGMAY